jgi:hypothetical protein
MMMKPRRKDDAFRREIREDLKTAVEFGIWMLVSNVAIGLAVFAWFTFYKVAIRWLGTMP